MAASIVGRWPEVAWACIVAGAVLVSGVALRAAGGWLRRSLGRDFRDAVGEVTATGMDEIKQSIGDMRSEQTEQHGQVRAEVAALGLRLDVSAARLDRIEGRIWPTDPETPGG